MAADLAPTTWDLPLHIVKVHVNVNYAILIMKNIP